MIQVILNKTMCNNSKEHLPHYNCIISVQSLSSKTYTIPLFDIISATFHLYFNILHQIHLSFPFFFREENLSFNQTSLHFDSLPFKA